MHFINLKKSYINWQKSCNYNVFGTLTFAVGRPVYLEQAMRSWFLFWSKMDRLTCWTINGQQTRIPRHVFVHRGAVGDNLHIHFLARVPHNVEDFCVRMNAIWSDLNASHAIPDQNDVTELQSTTGGAIYTLHEDHGDSVESFQPELSSSADPVFRDDAIARLTSAVKRSELLDEARTAYPRHFARRRTLTQKRAA